MKKVIMAIMLAGCLFAGMLGTSCSGGEESEEVKAIREYADPTTETTLQGLSENSYEKYSKHFSPEMKAAFTEEAFNQSAAQLNAQLGKYQSKTFLSTDEKDNYINVYYKAKYEKAEVRVQMVFDHDKQVVGQWFK